MLNNLMKKETMLLGQYSEVKEVMVEIKNENIVKAFEKILLEKLGINRDSATIHNDEIGYWHYDDCNGYYEHESDVWVCLCKDKEKVDIFKHMSNLYDFLIFDEK